MQTGVPQEDLGQILTQLRAISPPAPTVAQAHPVVPVPQPYPSPAPSYPYSTSAPPPPSLPPSSSYSIPPSYSSSNPVQPKVEPAEIASVTSVHTAPVASTSATPSVLPFNVSSLFNKIMQTGVLSSSSSSTPTGAGATAKREDSATPSDGGDPAKEYANAVLTSAPKLTSVDILKCVPSGLPLLTYSLTPTTFTRHKPAVAQLLYSNLPGQCKQCGLRFTSDGSGKKKLEEHLDMHFAQNRQAAQANGRGYSRSWFVSIDVRDSLFSATKYDTDDLLLQDWLNDGVVDPKGKRRAVGPKPSAKGVAAEEAAHRDAELRAMTVVVPPGDEAKAISCPICKEHLKSEFNEDDEEWVWRNAVQKDDRVRFNSQASLRPSLRPVRLQIYHATCHAEAMVSKTSLATRLKTEETSRSRSQTPEWTRSPARANFALPDDSIKIGSPSPSKLVGSKRKVDTDGSVSSRDSPTPPMKKIALSA